MFMCFFLILDFLKFMWFGFMGWMMVLLFLMLMFSLSSFDFLIGSVMVFSVCGAVVSAVMIKFLIFVLSVFKESIKVSSGVVFSGYFCEGSVRLMPVKVDFEVSKCSK